MDATKIVDLADKSGIAEADRANLVSFALGFAEGVRNKDSTDVVHLYGASVSGNVIPLWAFLEATGIPHEYHEVDIMAGGTRTPEFLAMNPYHCIPTIKHGDFTLHESGAICRYLCRAFPSATAKYYGNGDIRAQAVIDCSLDNRLGSLYQKFSPLLYAVMGFFPKPDDEAATKALQAVNTALEEFVTHFVKSKFIGGDHPSIGDLQTAVLVLMLRDTPFGEGLNKQALEWAARVEQAVPAIAMKCDGATNGVGFGSKQFMAMRSASYAALEVGSMNGK